MIALEKSTQSTVHQAYWTAEVRVPVNGELGTREKLAGIGPTPLDAVMSLAEALARRLQ